MYKTAAVSYCNTSRGDISSWQSGTRLYSHSQQQNSLYFLLSFPITSTPSHMSSAELCWYRCSRSHVVSPGAALISLKDNTAGEGKSDCDLVQHEATQTAVLAQHSKQELFMHPATDRVSIAWGAAC